MVEVRHIEFDALQSIGVGHTVENKLVVGNSFEVVVNIILDNLEEGIEDHTVEVGTMEVHCIEVIRIVASFDSIREAAHIEVEESDDDARRLLL